MPIASPAPGSSTNNWTSSAGNPVKVSTAELLASAPGLRAAYGHNGGTVLLDALACSSCSCLCLRRFSLCSTSIINTLALVLLWWWDSWSAKWLTFALSLDHLSGCIPVLFLKLFLLLLPRAACYVQVYTTCRLKLTTKLALYLCGCGSGCWDVCSIWFFRFLWHHSVSMDSKDNGMVQSMDRHMRGEHWCMMVDQYQWSTNKCNKTYYYYYLVVIIIQLHWKGLEVTWIDEHNIARKV